MKAQIKSWNDKEFLAYLLLYAAHADNQYSELEEAYILSKIEYSVYSKVWREYLLDNDYQHVQKIIAFQKQSPLFPYKTVMDELEGLFLADSYFHGMEAYMFTTIRHLLN